MMRKFSNKFQRSTSVLSLARRSVVNHHDRGGPFFTCNTSHCLTPFLILPYD